MSKVVRQIGFDEGAYVARDREAVVVGNEIIRHRLSSRVIHWSVGVSFFACLVTGLPVWTPVFAWMGDLVGGLSVCRVIHPFIGLLFAAAPRRDSRSLGPTQARSRFVILISDRDSPAM